MPADPSSCGSSGTFSPVLRHTAPPSSETLGGLSTIRAYRAAARFAVKGMEAIDRNAVVVMTQNCANRWLGLWLGQDFPIHVVLLGRPHPNPPHPTIGLTPPLSRSDAIFLDTTLVL